jgi:hypothetical protein
VGICAQQNWATKEILGKGGFGTVCKITLRTHLLQLLTLAAETQQLLRSLYPTCAAGDGRVYAVKQVSLQGLRAAERARALDEVGLSLWPKLDPHCPGLMQRGLMPLTLHWQVAAGQAPF